MKRTQRERGKAGQEGRKQERATVREGEEKSEWRRREGRVEGSSGNITSVRLCCRSRMDL